MKKTTRILSLLLAVAMLMCLAACGGTSSSTETAANDTPNEEAAPVEEPVSEPTEEEAAPEDVYTTLRIGAYASTLVGSVDPYARNIAVDTYGLRDLIYDPIFYPDPETGEMVSDIVESYEWSSDFLELTLKLKDNILFSNGEQMIGEDIIYAIENYQQGFTFGYFKAINCGASYVDDDNLTVHLVYDYQYGPGIKKLDCFIGDKSFLESIGEDADFFDISNAVGSGPYAITELIPDTSAKFELRDDYWGDSTFAVDCYECNVYTDQSTMAIDLENGVIDIALNASESDSARLLDAGTDVQVDIIGSGSVVMLGLSDETDKLSDPLVREAICHAIDTTALTEATYGCLGTPATGYLSESMKGYMKTDYEYDPDLSRELLKKAGVDNLDLYFATRSNGAYPAISDVLQAYLSEVGINLSIDVSDFVTLRTTTYQEPGGTDFQCITNADGSPEGEPYFCLSIFEEGNIFCALNKSDADFNESISKLRDNVDESIRMEGLEELQTWIHDNYWAIPLCEWNFSVMYNRNLVQDVNVGSAMRCSLRFVELA